MQISVLIALIEILQHKNLIKERSLLEIAIFLWYTLNKITND